MIAIDCKIELRSNLFFSGRALAALRGHGDGRFNLLGVLALRARSPIETSQAI